MTTVLRYKDVQAWWCTVSWTYGESTGVSVVATDTDQFRIIGYRLQTLEVSTTMTTHQDTKTSSLARPSMAGPEKAPAW